MTYPASATAVDLVFSTSTVTPPSGSVDLVFGGGAVVEPPVDPPVVVWRGVASSTSVAHNNAGMAMSGGTLANWQPTTNVLVAPTAVSHSCAAAADCNQVSSWNESGRAYAAIGIAHDVLADAMPATTVAAWYMPQSAHVGRSSIWHARADRSASLALRGRFGLSMSAPATKSCLWGAMATAASTFALSNHNAAAKKQHLQHLDPWGRSAKQTHSWGGPAYLPQPPSTPPVIAPVAVDLRFCALIAQSLAHRLGLVFGLNPCGYPTPDAPIYILPARFYMAVHSVEAHLLPSLDSIPIYNVTLSADIGSFAWTLSASAPADVFDALAPSGTLPAQLRITLDGMQWVFVVDSLQRSQQFGQRSTRIAGRSATALMGAPYSRETARLSASPYNAQQLAAQALDLTGVALDWALDDWLVPAGAWSHTGTPLAAVQAIAEAAGGYVNSHRSAATLLVRHPYPTLPGGIPGGPWNWGGAFAADVELAPDSIITSGIERNDGPSIDGVYVSGTTQGVLAHVKRTGTAGGNLASMITDPLITATAAAQQRGLSVLGAAGAKHFVQITLPVLTGSSQPGVLDVGQLVQINESAPWRGRVRSVSVQAAAQSSVRQSITLERHLQ